MGTYLPGLNFPIYSGWTQYTPVIPKLYWDVYSAEQRIKLLCINFDKVEHYLDYVAELMNEWNMEFSEDIRNEFEQMWNAIHEGYEDALNEWFENDMPGIIERAIKMVFFGLTLDGYFVAYIPDSWNEIQFDTGMVYGSEEYGRLILMFNVDNAFPTEPDIGEWHTDFGVLNNHVSQLEMDISALDDDLDSLETRVAANETTLYTPIEESEG